MDQNNILGDSVLNSKYFNPDYLFDKGVTFFKSLSNVTTPTSILPLYNTILIFLAIFFIVIIFYCVIRMFEIRKKEHHYLEQEIAEYAHKQKEKERKAQQNEEISKNPRWIKTLNYLFSEHESDWKLAVIEADSMLEDLLAQLGFKGETLGDKLKSTDQIKFRSLTLAWEVHTIRNRIAHEGTSFYLSQKEAKRVIAVYESIFREYGYI